MFFVCLNSWLDFSQYFFFGSVTRGVVFYHHLFPLDFFYCYRIFESQNWPRKFVNRWRIITKRHIKEWRPEISAAKWATHAASSARYTRSNCSARDQHLQRPANRATNNSNTRAGLETCKRLLLAEGVVWLLLGEAATVKSASGMGEQWLPFVVIAIEERKKWI